MTRSGFVLEMRHCDLGLGHVFELFSKVSTMGLLATSPTHDMLGVTMSHDVCMCSTQAGLVTPSTPAVYCNLVTPVCD